MRSWQILDLRDVSFGQTPTFEESTPYALRFRRRWNTASTTPQAYTSGHAQILSPQPALTCATFENARAEIAQRTCYNVRMQGLIAV
jgi:hypothetical protein